MSLFTTHNLVNYLFIEDSINLTHIYNTYILSQAVFYALEIQFKKKEYLPFMVLTFQGRRAALS